MPKPSFSSTRADERGEQDRRFAQRGNGGDRRARHRPQHDAVGRDAAEAAEQAAAPLRARCTVTAGGAAAPAIQARKKTPSRNVSHTT